MKSEFSFQFSYFFLLFSTKISSLIHRNTKSELDTLHPGVKIKKNKINCITSFQNETPETYIEIEDKQRNVQLSRSASPRAGRCRARSGYLSIRHYFLSSVSRAIYGRGKSTCRGISVVSTRLVER